jgi:hypothetical protein
VADEERREGPGVSLCTHCRNASTVTSLHGAMFYLCGLSFTDPRFAKYLTCQCALGDTIHPSESV